MNFFDQNPESTFPAHKSHSNAPIVVELKFTSHITRLNPTVDITKTSRTKNSPSSSLFGSLPHRSTKKTWKSRRRKCNPQIASNDAFENVTFSTAICFFHVHVSFLGPMILTSSILRGNDSMTVSAFKI